MGFRQNTKQEKHDNREVYAGTNALDLSLVHESRLKLVVVLLVGGDLGLKNCNKWISKATQRQDNRQLTLRPFLVRIALTRVSNLESFSTGVPFINAQ